MVEQKQSAEKRRNAEHEVGPELYLCRWNENILIVIVGVGDILYFADGHVHEGVEWLHSGRSVTEGDRQR